MPYARASTFRTGWRAIVVAMVTALILSSSPLPSAHAAIPEGASASDLDLPGGGYGFSRAERCLMRKINRIRRRHGRRALDRDQQIGYVARRHAYSMAARRNVFHDQSMGQTVTRWRRLGQNSGGGGRCPRIFRSFLRSPVHRATILGSWRHIGVGARWSGGRMYVQQIFESRRDPGNIYSYP